MYTGILRVYYKLYYNILFYILRVTEQRNILHEIRKRKAKCIGQILQKLCLLKQVIKGRIKGEVEVARRRGRRRKKLLDEFKDRRGYSHLKEEALDCNMWRHRIGGGFGPVVRQSTEWMKEYYIISIEFLLHYMNKYKIVFYIYAHFVGFVSVSNCSMHGHGLLKVHTEHSMWR